MKRLLTIAMALALTLTLAACGGNSNAPSGKDGSSTPKRSDDVNIQVQKAVSTADLLPLELVDSGFAVKDG